MQLPAIFVHFDIALPGLSYRYHPVRSTETSPPLRSSTQSIPLPPFAVLNPLSSSFDAHSSLITTLTDPTGTATGRPSSGSVMLSLTLKDIVFDERTYPLAGANTTVTVSRGLTR